MNRRTKAKVHKQNYAELDLPYQPPYDWQSILRFYQSHSITGIERVTEDYFERPFRIKRTLGIVRVQAGNNSLRVRVSPDRPGIVTEVKTRVRKRSEEHTSELQSHVNLVCRLLLEKKK